MDLVNLVFQDHLRELKVEKDSLGLWCIPWSLQEEHCIKDTAEIRKITFQILERFIDEPEIQFGNPTDDGSFVQWDTPRNQIMSRIEREWANLGRQPNIGDIVWLYYQNAG